MDEWNKGRTARQAEQSADHLVGRLLGRPAVPSFGLPTADVGQWSVTVVRSDFGDRLGMGLGGRNCL